MKGILTPDKLVAVGFDGYKRRFRTILKALKESTRKALAAEEEPPRLLFAIAHDFDFNYNYSENEVLDEGKEKAPNMVIVLPLTSKWKKSLRLIKSSEAGLDYALGEAYIVGETLVLEITRKFGLIQSTIKSGLKSEGYKILFQKIGFTTYSLDETEQEAVEMEEESFEELVELIQAFKAIDEEDEASQMEKLLEITEYIDDWEDPSEEENQKLIKIKANIAKNIREIELELAGEAWDDYKHFQANETVFATDKIDGEIEEMETLYNKWALLFDGKPYATEKAKMDALKDKIAEERAQYSSLKEEDDENSIEVEEESPLGQIKGLVDQLKQLGQEKYGQRMDNIKELQTAISLLEDESAINKVKKLATKLAQAKEAIERKDDEMVLLATTDFDDYSLNLKNSLNSLSDLDTEVKELQQLYLDWKETFGDHNLKNEAQMDELEEKILEEIEAFEQAKVYATKLEALFAKEEPLTKTEQVELATAMGWATGS